MKKAKDYIKELEEADFSEDSVKKAAYSVIMEMKEIQETRNARSDSAIIAIAKEQDNKWRAIVRKSNGRLNPDGFRLLLKKYFPFVEEHMPKSR